MGARRVRKTFSKYPLALAPTVGLDVRPRRQLGSLALSVMVAGGHVVCLKTKVSEQDPMWTLLRSTGLTEVWHMPSLPAGIDDEHLKLAKDGI